MTSKSIILLLITSLVLNLSLGEETKVDESQKVIDEIHKMFRPTLDVARAKQLTLLAETYDRDDEFSKIGIPYLIYSLIKGEVNALNLSEFSDEHLEKSRKEALAGLIEVQKKYLKYQSMLNLQKELEKLRKEDKPN